MYDKIRYMGKTLKEWREIMYNKYSLGELYRMSLDKVDFSKLCKCE